MSDPFARFEQFEKGVPVSPVPAQEIRRRGDRRRRRVRATGVAGAAATAAAVVVAVVALSTGSDPQVGPAVPGTASPTDTATDTAEPSLDAAVLRLADLPARERLAPWRPEAANRPALGCQPTGDTARLLDADDSTSRAFGAVLAPHEGITPDRAIISRIRSTVLQFADADAAASASATAAGWITDCNDPSVADRSAMTRVATGGGSATWTYSDGTCQNCDGGIVFDRMAVVQVDDRLVLVSLAEVGGPQEPAGLDESMDHLVAAAAERAGDTSASTTSGSALPADVPLDQGLHADTSEGGTLDGPSRTARGVDFPSGFCSPWPPDGTQDRLAVTVTGPEYADSRELLDLGTPERAQQEVAALHDAVSRCPRLRAKDPANDVTFTVLSGAGARPEAAFGYTYAQGTGGAVYDVVAVGRLVLATEQTGEWTPSSLEQGGVDLRSENASLIASLCESQGC